MPVSYDAPVAKPLRLFSLQLQLAGMTFVQTSKRTDAYRQNKKTVRDRERRRATKARGQSDDVCLPLFFIFE